MEFLSALLIGALLGAVVIYFFLKNSQKPLVSEEKIIEKIRDSMGSISLEALSKNTEQFLKIANEALDKQNRLGEEKLDGKKTLIDQQLGQMKDELQKVSELVKSLEKDREQKFGEVTSQLKTVSEVHTRLHETTKALKEALQSSKARGQWGERMAEDILRLAGFVENVNFTKQKNIDTGVTRPDFTFFLPQGLKVNMDVKFPFDNYLRYLEAPETEKETYKNQFLKDVRQRVKAVTTRDYINQAENTVDYVIVFIPNEQVYSFINEADLSFMDDAIKNKVIVCSPTNLYAVLAVIRQSIDNFNIQKTSGEILAILGGFYKQWGEFMRSFEKLGKKIDETQEEFNYLTTTRKNMIERPLRQVEELRKQKGIPLLDDGIIKTIDSSDSNS